MAVLSRSKDQLCRPIRMFAGESLNFYPLLNRLTQRYVDNLSFRCLGRDLLHLVK
jgi:hypothetical protein